MKISWNSGADDGVGPDLTSFKSVPILDFSKLLHPRTDRFKISKKERKKEIGQILTLMPVLEF